SAPSHRGSWWNNASASGHCVALTNGVAEEEGGAGFDGAPLRPHPEAMSRNEAAFRHDGRIAMSAYSGRTIAQENGPQSKRNDFPTFTFPPENGGTRAFRYLSVMQRPASVPAKGG